MENAPGKKRPGRPRTTDLYGGHIRQAEDIVADHLPQCVHNLIALADGCWTEETLRDGTRRVYQELPDRASNEYLLNRIMGKPTEIQEVSGPNGEPMAYVDRAHNHRDKKHAGAVNGNGHTGNGVAP